MEKTVTFKTEDAWFWCDAENVIDSLRVVFISECDSDTTGIQHWYGLSDEAKNNRIKAIHTALKDITITDVEFVHPQVRNACDGITNVFNLFQFMDRNPDAILTCVDWAWDIEYGLSAENIRAYISVGTLLKNLAPFIVEDILDIEAALYTHGQEKATPVMEDQHNTIVLNACDKDAWLVADESNVTDSLCVIFESERIYEKPLTASWDAMSPLAKDVRKRAIDETLHDIAIDKTVFTNTEAYPACYDIMNLYELFKFLQEHPEARLTEVYCDDECLSSPIIGVRELLMFVAEYIAEDILDIEAEHYARFFLPSTGSSDKHTKDAKPFIDDRYNTITFKTIDPEAWLWADKSNVADTLRVMFEDEITVSEGLTKSWVDMDPHTKDVRSQAIDDALHEIAITEVVFANSADYSEWGVGTSSLYELFVFLNDHPESRLAGVYSGNEYFCSSSIGVRELLLHFAEDIAETILDIEHCECEDSTDDSTEEKLLKLDSAIARGERICGSDDKVVCAAKKARKRIADETSPVEVSKAFMKDQYDKHTDLVDAIEGARNYFNTDDACTRVNDDDNPVNHPKHYQASNGLEAIDCIEAFVEDLPGDIGYLIGNAMKYLCRFDKKGKPVEDLQKARWYIERAIKNIESRKM